MSSMPKFVTLEDDVGFWLGFGIFFLIWIWSLVFDTPIFQIASAQKLKQQLGIGIIIVSPTTTTTTTLYY